MLSQVADKLDSWFGRSFLLGVYLPCVVFAAINAVVACLGHPQVRTWVKQEYHQALSDKASDLLIFLASIAVVSFALSPMARLASVWMEGRGLPAWVAEPLLLHHARRRDALMSRSRQAQQRRLQLPSSEEVVDTLRRRREAGAALGRASNPVALARASLLVEELRERRLLNRPAGTALILETVAALGEALSRNCADFDSLKPPVSAEDLRAARKLDELHEEVFGTLIPYVIDVAERAEERESNRLSAQFADVELAPTRLGNEAARLRSYCRTRYGMELDVIWPRLQLVIQKDDALATAIMRAKIQVDFSMVSLVLTTLSGVGWLVASAAGDTPLILLATAILVPLWIICWLKLLSASYDAFSEVVRSAVDLNRRELLRRLSLVAPPSLSEERETWDRLCRWLQLNEVSSEITFAPDQPK